MIRDRKTAIWLNKRRRMLLDTGFAASATKFDGTNDYLTHSGDLTSNADAKVGLASFWINPTSLAATARITYNDGGKFDVNVQTDGKIQFIAKNSASTTILDYSNTNNTLSTGSWFHVLATWDLANSIREIYINDSQCSIFQSTLTNDTIDYTVANHYIAANQFGSGKLAACLSEVYFTNEYLDITTESNRRKFIDASGKPVDLGADGSTPTGTQPLIYLPNPFGTFEQNAGSGGNFTVTGALEACASSPSD